MKVFEFFLVLIFFCFSKNEVAQETHEFQAEVSRMMDIIINSLYTDREVFLRELVSNAADALDKIRFQSIQDPQILGINNDLSIKISFDSEKKIIQVEDSGIGMTKQDMIQNLGTLAKSGTTNFIEHIKAGNMNLIGQFGVGFYSAFLVANKVQVYSKHNDDKLYVWESSAANSFTISETNDVELSRGSIVVLHLKQDALDYANEQTIKNLLQRYSEFITFPIYLKVSKTITKEVPSDDEETDKISVETDDLETKEQIEKDIAAQKMKKVTETVQEWAQQNLEKPIWIRDKTEIELDEYKNFYKNVFKSSNEFITHLHFKGEGEVEFKALLFIPKYQQIDYFSKYHDKGQNMKLYVRRVLIQDKFEDLCPKYLNFVEGIIDSDDLPLNVNREGLQQLKLMKVIGKKITKKILDMISDLSKDEQLYETFWKEYGRTMKFGLMDDKMNRDKLSKLARFYSSHNTSQITSLDKYIERMKEGQDQIYYIAGENIQENMKSPVIQSLIENNYEVLLLTDPIDEFALNDVQTYEGKKLINVSKGEFKLPQSSDDKKYEKKLRKMYNPLTEWWQKLRKDQFQEVLISKRLTQDPCVVVGVEGGYSANQERIQKAQAHGDSKFRPKTRMILEINPNHPIIKKLLNQINQESEQNEETANLLTDTALIVSGFGVENKLEFSTRFYQMVANQYGIQKDEEIIKVQFDDNDDDGDIEDIKPQSDDFTNEFEDISLDNIQNLNSQEQIDSIVDDL